MGRPATASAPAPPAAAAKGEPRPLPLLGPYPSSPPAPPSTHAPPLMRRPAHHWVLRHRPKHQSPAIREFELRTYRLGPVPISLSDVSFIPFQGIPRPPTGKSS